MAILYLLLKICLYGKWHNKNIKNHEVQWLFEYISASSTFRFVVVDQHKTLKQINRRISATDEDGYCLLHAVREQMKGWNPTVMVLWTLVWMQGHRNAKKYARFLSGGEAQFNSLLQQCHKGGAYQQLLEHMDLVFTILYDTIEQPIAVIRCNGDLDFYPKGSDPVTDDTIVVCQTSPCHYDATKPRSKYIQLSSFPLYSYNKLLKPLVYL